MTADPTAHGRRLDPRLPSGPLESAWQRTLEDLPLVSPSNRRRLRVLVVGSGLAGASAAAALAEQGYAVQLITYHDSPRRAHSVAAQGGINAARNYANDGDSVRRLFRDTVKGGDFRAREAGCYRLAEISGRIIDHCVAQGVPFARDYGGTLANRSFGGAQVSRTFYARGQTGQQLLYGAHASLLRQVEAGRVQLLCRRDLLDLITVDGMARGVVVRHQLDGALEAHTAEAVLLATGGYSNVYFLSTNALHSNATAIWRAHLRGALFANPCFTQIHPTCIPPGDALQSKLTLMSESLRNDGRIWLPLQPGDTRPPAAIPESERDYVLERLYPAYGNLVPRDLASRRLRELCAAGRGVGSGGQAVYLDLAEAIAREGGAALEARYGNLLQMYERITGEDPRTVPMRIAPAPHYTMGGLWVDYHLMSTIPGLFVLGEANFSEHGANRLGASALMQGLADGTFIARPRCRPGWRVHGCRRWGRSTPPAGKPWRRRRPASAGCGRSGAAAPWTICTGPWGSGSRRCAASAATPRGCAAASRPWRPSAPASTPTSACRRAAPRSSRSWRRPCGWRTSSAWPT